MPVTTLDKSIRERLEIFVAAAFEKETAISKQEKEISKTMEKAEWNLSNIETDIDGYVNDLVSCIFIIKVNCVYLVVRYLG